MIRRMEKRTDCGNVLEYLLTESFVSSRSSFASTREKSRRYLCNASVGYTIQWWDYYLERCLETLRRVKNAFCQFRPERVVWFLYIAMHLILHSATTIAKVTSMLMTSTDRVPWILSAIQEDSSVFALANIPVLEGFVALAVSVLLCFFFLSQVTVTVCDYFAHMRNIIFVILVCVDSQVSCSSTTQANAVATHLDLPLDSSSKSQ